MSTALQIRTPVLPAEVSIDQAWINRRDALVAEAKQITAVADQDQYENAEILLKRITKHSNSAEKLRKDYSKPFQGFAKSIKKMADEARANLETEKTGLKKVMADYLNAVERKRQEEVQRKAREELAKREAELEAQRKRNLFKPVEEIPEPEPTPEPIQVEADTAEVDKTMTSARKVWLFEVTDPDQVPRCLCIPDPRKIRALIFENQEQTDIPGVRIWSETRVQSR